MAKRVAVIGAGPAGLATVKELLEEGLEPTCFEKASNPGGVFRPGGDEGLAWRSCRLTSSGALTSFSDFPLPPGQHGHLTAGEYRNYLEAYTDAFGVRPRIRFRTRVESVRRDVSDGWTVRIVDETGHASEERFDAVAVCSGLHQNPHTPSFPGLDRFAGAVMHSSTYLGPDDVRGKRVLVVGGGESGADITAEVARTASETVLSLRRGVAVLPRWRHGWPNDYRTSRLMNSAAHWIFLTRNPADAWKRRVYHLLFLPVAVIDKLVQGASGFVSDLLPLLHPRHLLANRATRTDAKTRRRMRRLARALLRESGGTVDEQFGTKDEEFVRAMAEGRCRRVKGVDRFDGTRVVFEDGNTFEPDVVIFCTGFVPRVQVLEESLAKERRYLHLINPAAGPSLGFIGMVRPAFGAIPPIAELQARYFALLQSEQVRLPGEDQMRQSIDRNVGFRQHVFRAVRGRLDHLVDFTSFCDEIAAQIGCNPSRDDIRREPRAFRVRFFASAFVAAQYRLVGPHAKPMVARQVITSLPISHPAPMIALYYVRWMLSRALHRLLGAEFAPKLALRSGR